MDKISISVDWQDLRPPHEPRDKKKVKDMVEILRQGGELTQIVYNGSQALSGSHRLEALYQAKRLWDQEADGWDDSPEPSIGLVNMPDRVYNKTMEELNMDPIYDSITDFDTFLEVSGKKYSRYK